jgi:hypothetical protein
MIMVLLIVTVLSKVIPIIPIQETLDHASETEQK